MCPVFQPNQETLLFQDRIFCLLPGSKPLLPLPRIPGKPSRPSLPVQILSISWEPALIPTFLHEGFSEAIRSLSFAGSLLYATSHFVLTKTLRGKSVYPQFKNCEARTQSRFKNLVKFAQHSRWDLNLALKPLPSIIPLSTIIVLVCFASTEDAAEGFSLAVDRILKQSWKIWRSHRKNWTLRFSWNRGNTGSGFPRGCDLGELGPRCLSPWHLYCHPARPR